MFDTLGLASVRAREAVFPASNRYSAPTNCSIPVISKERVFGRDTGERLASSLPRRSPIVTATAASWPLRSGTPSGRQQLR
jgi:hypothetical protein